MSSGMVEVVIDSIRVHLMAPQRVVVLKQVNAERYLTIWVGPYEAEAITVALQEVEMVRPLTHDLLKNVFKAFNARIVRVEIVKLQDDIYYGIAARAHAPIMVHPSVMESAGVVPDQDMPEAPMAPARKETPPPLSDDASDRLSVFKDFIEKLDIDDPDKDKPDSPPA